MTPLPTRVPAWKTTCAQNGQFRQPEHLHLKNLQLAQKAEISLLILTVASTEEFNQHQLRCIKNCTRKFKVTTFCKT